MKGIHNVKMGATFQHTLLTENFGLGLTDPTINSPCLSEPVTPRGKIAKCLAGSRDLNGGTGHKALCLHLIRLAFPMACFKTNQTGPVHLLDKGAVDIRLCIRTTREIIGN